LLNTVFGTLSSGVAPVTSSYESISTVTVGAGGSSSITFSSIPSTYTHLQVRYMAVALSGTTEILMKINSGTGANYARHDLYGNGSAAGVSASASSADPYIQGYISSVVPTNPCVGVVDILDYANTNKYKTSRILTGVDKNGSGGIEFNSLLWMNTNAITTLNIYGTGTFGQYSSFALYGIKGS
jgi:hypothetical protein